MDNVVDILVKTTDQASAGVTGIVSNITGLSARAIESLGGIGTAAVGSVVGIAALGTAAFALGDAFTQSYDQIRVGTGATGEELDALKGNFKQVVQDVPADFGDASTAVTQLHDQLNLAGPALTNLSEQFLNLSRITKTNVNEDIKAGTDVFKNWNVAASEQGPVLDMLFQASQATGMGFTQLAGQLATNGVKLREMGLDVTGATGFLASLYKAGVDVSSVMPAMSKEFATAAKEGKSAGDVMAETFHKIQNAPNQTAAAAVAMEVFGKKAGPQMAELIREGKVSLEALQGQIRDFGSDTINAAAKDTEHFGEKLTELKNRIMVLAEPVAISVFDAISNAAASLAPLFDRLVAAVTPFFNSIRDNQNVMTALAVVLGGVLLGAVVALGIAIAPVVAAIASAAGPALAVGAALGVLAAAISYAWNNFDGFHNAVMAVVTWLQANVPSILEKVGSAFSTLRDALNPLITFIQSHTEVFERLGQGLAILAGIVAGVLVVALAAAAAAVLILVAAIATIAVVIGAAIAVIYQIGQVLWDVFQNAKNAVATAGGAITSFFANLGQAALTGVHAIGAAFAAIPGAIGAVAGAIGAAIGAVVSFFVSLPGRIVSAVAALPGMLANVFSTAMHGVLFAIGFAAGTIVSVVVNLVLGIVHAAQALPGQIASVFTAAWNIAVTVTTALVNAVVSFFQQLPGRAMGVLSALWGVITSVFSTAENMAVTTTVALVSAVINFFATLPGRAAGAVASLWASISGAFSSAQAGATSAASNIVTAVAGWLAQLPGRAASALSGFAGAVTGALSSAVSAATSIGGDIVRGVAAGITGGVGWVIDAARSAASSIMDGFKSALHIGSPSRRMADEIGVPMAQGIGVGVQDAAPALQNTLKSVVDKVVASASAAVMQAGGGLADAASELMRTVSSGTFVEEDLSFRGMSSNYQRYQSQLADMFWAQNQGRNFGTGTWERGAEMAFAQGVANQVTFNGNTSDALATVIMQLIRTGKIQISAAAVTAGAGF